MQNELDTNTQMVQANMMSNQKTVIPAIMPDTYEDLVDMVSVVRDHVEWVQIDVMDGEFTESVSWPYATEDIHFKQLIAEEEGLPHWGEVNYSVDMMVSDPYSESIKWIAAGVARIIVHIESMSKSTPENVEFLSELQARGVEVCLALGTKTPIAVLDDFEGHYDSLQMMGIEHIGYQGEPFVESVLDTISALKKKNPQVVIGVDGGVNVETIDRLKAVGVDRYIIGSGIFAARDEKHAIKRFEKSLGE